MLDSFELAKENLIKKDLRNIRDFGIGATSSAFSLIQAHIEKASEVVSRKIDQEDRPSMGPLMNSLEPLDHDVLALVALQGSLDAVASCQNLSKTYVSIGRMVQDEVYAFGLRTKGEKLAARLEAVARQRNSSLKARRAAVMSMASRAGFVPGDWADSTRVVAGQWMVEVALELPEVFALVRSNEEFDVEAPYLTITQEALEYTQEFVRRLIERYPVSLPLTTPPGPWTATKLPVVIREGTYEVPLVRKEHCAVTQSHLRAAVEDGSLKPVLDSLSQMQATAWRINEPVLEALQWARDHVELEGLPPTRDIPKPPKVDPAIWEAMTEESQKLHRKGISSIVKKNRGFLGEREEYKMAIETSKFLVAEGNRFWTPVSMDYRGRVYPVTHFSFQRQDYVRGLFEFADGKPLGPDGFYWLAIHLANSGDFERVSKKPFEERIAWVKANHSRIMQVHEDFANLAEWWTQADSPFMFLAACMEYAEATYSGNPTKFVSHLPVSFDGSCSGLQHFAAMTRCETTAPLVNLLPSEGVADVYQTVADKVRSEAERIAGDPTHQEQATAKVCLAEGIGRGLVKRNVMTWAYSSKKFGMVSQVAQDTMRTLNDEVIRGKLSTHPYALEGDVFPGHKAARFLGHHTFDSIENTLDKPAEAMRFLQSIARALSHEKRPVVWHTPMGMPVVLYYPNIEIKQVQLYLQDRGVRIKTKANLAVASHGIDKVAAANAIAPSFVHSYDACHLQMVVAEASQQGIHDFALVHDSFGCHAADARKFRKVIAQTFHKLYAENDVLGMIYEEALAQTHTASHRISTPPPKGSYNIEEVLHATYAFA